MPHRLISKYLAATEARIARRTISDRDFYLITIPLALIAAGGVAALSFVVSIPGLS
jgi:hypothetical protein